MQTIATPKDNTSASRLALPPGDVLPKTEWSSFPGRWQRPAAPALFGVRTRPWCCSWAARQLGTDLERKPINPQAVTG